MADGSDEPNAANGELPATAHVGRVGLRVDTVDRVRPFYEEAVGLAAERRGTQVALGPSPDEPLLILEEDSDAPERSQTAAGLFHVAIRVPHRASLGDAVTRLRSAGASLSGASDHLVSEALYLRDPAGNGVELYCDRPAEEWPHRDDGHVDMQTLPLDLDDLEAAGGGESLGRMPPGTDVGHVHLEVTDLPRTEEFYREALGLRLRARYGTSAAFLAAGDYHHHVGANTWNHRTDPAGDHQGLAWWEIVLPDVDALKAATGRLTAAGYLVVDRDECAVVEDPDEIELRLVVRED